MKRWHTRASILTFLITFFGFLPSSSYAAAEEETTFVVTAYYSPLPNQSFYFKWSYEAEIKLNGNGTNGASGKPVYAGMLAAPKTYNFGTQIYLEWVGLGSVEDRGGAIVSAGERGQVSDRIDIWMGQWEAGLKRALLWWRRLVKGKIMTDTTGLNTIDFWQFDRWEIDFSKLPSVKNSTNVVLTELSDLGYDAYGPKLEDMIFAFQKDYHIVNSKSEAGAGNYGPKTQAKLAEVYSTYQDIRVKEEALIQASRDELLSAREAWKWEQKKAQAYIDTLGTPKLGDKGDHVRELQVFLKNLGYFNGKDTGIMWANTVISLKKYQREHWIIVSWRLDMITKIALASDKLFMAEKQV